jgi:phosphoglycolate phosphatase-like HAD superfamily hydrolase
MLARYALALAVLCLSTTPLLADPLPSWRDTDAKARIMDFVESVTDPQSDQYVTPPDRIAVFDNDGTLWSEKPFYFQLLYAIDRVRERAEADPSILTSDALKAAAEGDIEGVLAEGKEGLLDVLAISHSGVSVADFQADVRNWLETARHPSTGMAYNEMLYQPMLELLAYLRDAGFSTWIVSGGGVHFIRAFAAEAYGIPPHQVVGSVGPARYEANGAPVIVKEPGIFFINDKAGKPLAIDSQIGKRPIFAAGNSDGDFQMLEWTTAGDGPRFGMIIHHTDGAREFAYDRKSHVGKLVRALDEGPARGWLIVDMAKDWAQIWPSSTE